MKPTDRVQVRGVGGSFESAIEAIEPGGGIVVRKGTRRMVVAPDRVRLLDPPQPARTPLERPAVYDAPELTAQPKDPPGRHEAYLAFVRAKPCCSCPAPGPSDPHHYAPKGRGGGMGMKCDDRRTVPLCRLCHDHFHNHGFLPLVGARGFPSSYTRASVSPPEWQRLASDATHLLFMETQVALLVEWVENRRKP